MNTQTTHKVKTGPYVIIGCEQGQQVQRSSDESCRLAAVYLEQGTAGFSVHY